EQEIEDIFGGNLCRCTGYRPILQGMRSLACDYKSECAQQSCLVDPSFDVKKRDEIKKINLEQLPAHDLPSKQLYFHGG
ncbi:2Fe-2S iron-sulfur cluster-binding protein, partial [Acinetobacter baumannii]